MVEVEVVVTVPPSATAIVAAPRATGRTTFTVKIPAVIVVATLAFVAGAIATDAISVAIAVAVSRAVDPVVLTLAVTTKASVVVTGAFVVVTAGCIFTGAIAAAHPRTGLAVATVFAVGEAIGAVAHAVVTGTARAIGRATGPRPDGTAVG